MKNIKVNWLKMTTLNAYAPLHMQIWTTVDINTHKIMHLLLYDTGNNVKREDSHISKFIFTELSISGK